MTNLVASSWPRRINRYNIEPVQKEYWVTGYPHCELAAFVITVDTWLFILWLFVVSGGVFDNQIRTYHNQFSMFPWFFPQNICVFFPWKLYIGCFERDRILPYIGCTWPYVSWPDLNIDFSDVQQTQVRLLTWNWHTKGSKKDIMKITGVQVCYAGWIHVFNDLILVIKH